MEDWGIKTVAYFEIVTTFALVIGLGFANLFKPGEGMIDVASQQIRLNEIANNMASATSHNSFGEMLLDLFPTSIVQSMADGNLLQIVVFQSFLHLQFVLLVKSPAGFGYFKLGFFSNVQIY